MFAWDSHAFPALFRLYHCSWSQRRETFTNQSSDWQSYTGHHRGRCIPVCLSLCNRCGGICNCSSASSDDSTMASRARESLSNTQSWACWFLLLRRCRDGHYRMSRQALHPHCWQSYPLWRSLAVTNLMSICKHWSYVHYKCIALQPEHESDSRTSPLSCIRSWCWSML